MDSTGVATLYLSLLETSIDHLKKELIVEITERILSDNDHFERLRLLESRLRSGEGIINSLSDNKYDKTGGVVSGNILVPRGKIISGSQMSSKYCFLDSDGFVQISDGTNVMVITPTKIEVSGPDENSNIDLTPAVALFNVESGVLSLRSEYTSIDLPSLTINGVSVMAGENPLGVGTHAGEFNQGTSSIAIGFEAGQYTQGSGAISIGFQSGKTEQGNNTIAIGNEAGTFLQRENAIAIGTESGKIQQGENSIAIGYLAGSQQANNSIVISAKGTVVTGFQSNATYLAPLRPVSQSNSIGYDTTTHELTYFPTPKVGQLAYFSIDSTLSFQTGFYWELIKFNVYNMNDSDITYDPFSGEITIPSGVWQISWSLQWGNGGTTPRWFGIQTGPNIVPGPDGQTLIAASNTNGNIWANGSHVFSITTTTPCRFWTSGGQVNTISISDKPSDYKPVVVTRIK